MAKPRHPERLTEKVTIRSSADFQRFQKLAAKYGKELRPGKTAFGRWIVWIDKKTDLAEDDKRDE